MDILTLLSVFCFVCFGVLAMFGCRKMIKKEGVSPKLIYAMFFLTAVVVVLLFWAIEPLISFVPGIVKSVMGVLVTATLTGVMVFYKNNRKRPDLPGFK